MATELEAARLMGARVILAGISPEVAQTMVTLGIDLGRILTVGDLQSGIERAEQLLGYVVTRSRAGELAAG
jgi:rsbT co-antagonist protein RsbR